MADTRSDYGFRCACVFIKIHKYISSSRHQLFESSTILIPSLQDADFVYYSFKKVSISSKKTDALSLPCNINSSDGLRGSIAYASNSQMASTLSQIRVACSTTKMSSFPLETVKNVQAMKSYRFLQ